MDSPGKPITERRLARMRGTLARRQPDLAVVVENIHDAHNVSAMLRSCDAVGAATTHLVFNVEEAPVIAGGVSASDQRWLDLRRHDSIEACYTVLRRDGLRIYATTLGEFSHDLYDLDLTKPVAFVFGNQRHDVVSAAICAVVIEHLSCGVFDEIPVAGVAGDARDRLQLEEGLHPGVRSGNRQRRRRRR